MFESPRHGFGRRLQLDCEVTRDSQQSCHRLRPAWHGTPYSLAKCLYDSHLSMWCSYCMSSPADKAYVSVNDDELELEREFTLVLCDECFRSFETVSTTLSRKQPADELRTH